MWEFLFDFAEFWSDGSLTDFATNENHGSGKLVLRKNCILSEKGIISTFLSILTDFKNLNILK